MEQIREQVAMNALGGNTVRLYAQNALRDALAFEYGGWLLEASEHARFAADLLQAVASQYPWKEDVA
jgi:hypothetical protein